jgi:hypothetical protein
MKSPSPSRLHLGLKLNKVVVPWTSKRKNINDAIQF